MVGSRFAFLTRVLPFSLPLCHFHRVLPFSPCFAIFTSVSPFSLAFCIRVHSDFSSPPSLFHLVTASVRPLPPSRKIQTPRWSSSPRHLPGVPHPPSQRAPSLLMSCSSLRPRHPQSLKTASSDNEFPLSPFLRSHSSPDPLLPPLSRFFPLP